ncbi:MAG: glycosyl transferase family 36 [bacterium]|nr:glycosyl transferase family 36 [bacterium]
MLPPNSNTKYGHFSPDGREYIITRPDTPRPWINILTNGRYTSLVSHTGGGYSFLDEPVYNRITRGVPGEQILQDRPGRYLYVRDNDSGEYWSINWQPVMAKPEFWEARIGLGYNKIVSLNRGIQGEVTFFVPEGIKAEVWMVKIKNTTERVRNLSVTSYVEWVLGNYMKDLYDRVFDSLFNDAYFEDNTVFATKRRWERPDKPGLPWNLVAYMSGDLDFECYDCVKENFIGQYRYLSNPIAVEKGECQNAYGESEDAIGSLTKILTLKPKEEISFNIFVGVEQTKKEAKKTIKFLSKKENVIRKFNERGVWWDKYLDKFVVETPDPDFNLSVNIWNKYQSWITANLGEMTSYYHGGGDFGFRDEAQHLFGVLPFNQDFAKEWTKKLLEHQGSDGKVAHNWNLTTGKAVVTDHSDDPQWLVMAVLNFIKETGETQFLEERVNFLDKGAASVLDHLTLALDYTLYHVSPNGIPLRRTADWNDALAGGHLGKGESLMVANQVASNILELLPILDKMGKKAKARVYVNIYDHLKKTINEQYWDGEWYVRATDDEGNFIGSQKNKEGKIHINGQTWPVISHIASGDRAEEAMNSLWKHLQTEYGALSFTPAYTKMNSALGIISQFAPGTKENATIFSHPNAWVVIAEAILGRGDKAYEAWKRSSFLTRSKQPDIYKVEPYVYAEFSYGPQNPHFGQGKYSWMTGSAAWFLRACTDWILGVRPTVDGLIVDPCIPKSWQRFKVKREFRGAVYNISVNNEAGVFKGVKEIKVDGKLLKEKILPVFKSGQHNIEVKMGEVNTFKTVLEQSSKANSRTAKQIKVKS